MIGSMEPKLHREMLDLATQLAREAAAISLPRVGQRPSGRKADASLVTETDHAIEDHILRAITAAYPDHAVIAEETAVASRQSKQQAPRYYWVVDPLDGTRNFVAGFPCFATAIAVLDYGRPVVACVYEHNLGALYAAILGKGATLNGRPLRIRPPDPGEDWLVGGPSTKDVLTINVVQQWIATKGLIYRNVGSSAMHLAWVATGALAAAFAKRCKIWDVAAGMLLVTEAGGRVTSPAGDELLPLRLDGDPNEDVPYLAASQEAHSRMVEMIGPLVRAPLG